jgi:hypothetical protein
MTTHDLKIEAEQYAEVICGNKTFQSHPNPCEFHPGDTVVLHEMSELSDAPGYYQGTGRRCAAEVGYLSDDKKRGVTVFSLLNVKVEVA